VLLAPPPEGAVPGYVHCRWSVSGSPVEVDGDVIEAVEIDFDPITSANSAAIASFLDGLHFTRSTAAGVTEYSSVGDESAPARADLLSSTFWVTAAVTPGGAANGEQATQIAHEVLTVLSR
jgi:hypothetical protein